MECKNEILNKAFGNDFPGWNRDHAGILETSMMMYLRPDYVDETKFKDEILQFVPDEEQKDDSDELLNSVYRRIAFLTKAYREVMIMYYIDGLSTAEIAKQQNTSEGAVRQRLFSARQKIKSEVEEILTKSPLGELSA